MNPETTQAKKKIFKFPHTYVLLFFMIAIMALCTYIIPAGQYARVEDPNTGRTVVDPSSYAAVAQQPVGFFDFLQAVPKGLGQAQEIVFFIFIVGGAFSIITATGAIHAGIMKAVRSLKGFEKIMLPIIMLIFAAGGATFGMAEETIVFIPIGIALARAMGYDAIVGMGIISLGAACGFNSGVMNPFTVGVAQGIAELPLFSAWQIRLAVLLVTWIISAIYLLRYAEKVRKDPQKSLVHNLEVAEAASSSTSKEDDGLNMVMTGRHSLVLLGVVIGFGFVIWGVFKQGWYIIEIASVFLGMGIACGLIGGFGPSRIAQEFIAGAKDIAMGALVCGIARGILVVMQDGLIIDTVVHGLASSIQNLPKIVAAEVMMLVQVVINLFIPSGSGQAAATMPIMIPLADVIGLTRQTAVMAFQFGDGFTNSIIPTSGTLLATLSMAKIPYEKWVRFIAPLMCIWIGTGMIFMAISVATNLGPF